MVILIALLHIIPPVLGALMGGRAGLKTGTTIGVVLAFVTGALIFTIPDLIGVGIGYVIGAGLVRD